MTSVRKIKEKSKHLAKNNYHHNYSDLGLVVENFLGVIFIVSFVSIVCSGFRACVYLLINVVSDLYC
ncbi:hypothetical protein DB91_02020 [Ehrlichia sp. Wisconsin_h]|nr:hypothetical protein DB91_02020 [Ehrlichia sp. Wisconsin_h]